MSKKNLDRLIRNSISTDTIIQQGPEEAGDRDQGARRMKNAKWIRIEKIKPDPNQPRKTFKEESLEELSVSIREHGIRQPICVEYEEQKGWYRIVHGERRYRASKTVGLEEMPCIVQGKTEGILRFAQQLVENIHREDLSPVDKARALLELKESMGNDSTWEYVEQRVGISETRRKQFVALLKLPEEIQKEIVAIGRKPSKNRITEKHARALLMLNKMPEKQEELFLEIKNGNSTLSGDEAVERAKGLKGKSERYIFRISYHTREELIEKLENALSGLRAELEGVPR